MCFVSNGFLHIKSCIFFFLGEKWVGDLKAFKVNWEKEYLSAAPYIVLLFKQTYWLDAEGNRREHHYNEISCCISAGEEESHT